MLDEDGFHSVLSLYIRNIYCTTQLQKINLSDEGIMDHRKYFDPYFFEESLTGNQ